MELALTERQRMIKRTAREIAEEHFAETAFEWDDETRWENARTLAEHDLLAITIPREYGGEGMSPLDAVVAMEGVGSVCPDSAGLIHGASFGPPRAIAEYGDEPLKGKYLPSIAEGSSRVGIAISEPEAGSDLRNLSTSAEPDGDGYAVHGRKAWVSSPGDSDAFLTYVRMPDGHVGAFVVDSDAEGFEIGDPDQNMAGNPQAELFFEDVYVPPENALTSGPDAFKQLIRAYNIERVGAAAKVWVSARWAFEESLRYVEEREQFGQPIGEFQAVQHRLADMATKLETARLLVYRALSKEGLPSRYESSMAKVYAAEVGQEVVDAALQNKGASGYVGDTPESYLYRRVRGYQIAGGTNDIHRNMIAKSLRENGMPEFGEATE